MEEYIRFRDRSELRNTIIMRHHRNGLSVSEIVKRMQNTPWKYITADAVKCIVAYYSRKNLISQI